MTNRSPRLNDINDYSQLDGDLVPWNRSLFDSQLGAGLQLGAGTTTANSQLTQDRAAPRRHPGDADADDSDNDDDDDASMNGDVSATRESTERAASTADPSTAATTPAPRARRGRSGLWWTEDDEDNLIEAFYEHNPEVAENEEEYQTALAKVEEDMASYAERSGRPVRARGPIVKRWTELLAMVRKGHSLQQTATGRGGAEGPLDRKLHELFAQHKERMKRSRKGAWKQKVGRQSFRQAEAERKRVANQRLESARAAGLSGSDYATQSGRSTAELGSPVRPRSTSNLPETPSPTSLAMASPGGESSGGGIGSGGLLLPGSSKAKNRSGQAAQRYEVLASIAESVQNGRNDFAAISNRQLAIEQARLEMERQARHDDSEYRREMLQLERDRLLISGDRDAKINRIEESLARESEANEIFRSQLTRFMAMFNHPS